MSPPVPLPATTDLARSPIVSQNHFLTDPRPDPPSKAVAPTSSTPQLDFSPVVPQGYKSPNSFGIVHFRELPVETLATNKQVDSHAHNTHPHKSTYTQQNRQNTWPRGRYISFNTPPWESVHHEKRCIRREKMKK